MNQLSEEEQRKIMESPPKGTLAIVLLFGAIFTSAWLLMFFARFLPHGPVN